MMKKQLFRKGKKRAAVGLAICFAATVALTGAYTWRNYQDNLKQEALLEEEAKKKEMAALEEKAQKANYIAKKEEEQKREEQEKQEIKNETSVSGTQVEAVTTGFTEANRLLWPVEGNVLMSYSMDKSVYFATLDQYKYNPALIISSVLNDNVIAAAPGTVKSIDNFRETGSTVTVDMGNGYECLYGQLKDVNVKVGDSVQAKDVLGYINEPTKYYSVEGPNLYFEMRKDGQPINPIDFME